MWVAVGSGRPAHHAASRAMSRSGTPAGSRTGSLAGRHCRLGVHASAWLAVGVLLIAADTLSGRVAWSVLPMLGWGAGLALHGLVVTLEPVERLYERLAEGQADAERQMRRSR